MSNNNTTPIPTNWYQTTLGGTATAMYSGGTPLTSEPGYYGGNIPWLRTQEVNFNYINTTEMKISDQGLKESSARWVPENSVVIAMYGNSAGRVAYSNIPLTTNQACCNIVTDTNKADPKFIFFNLENRYKELEGMANGGAQQNLSVGVLKKVSMMLPPLQEQKEIAAILSSLDDKIELLRQENKTLESIAKSLFKHWFVDFEFPNEEGEPYKSSGGKMIPSELGPIPEGWRVEPLDTIADFLNGVASQKYPPKNVIDYLPVIKIKEMNSGITKESDKASKDIDPKYIVKSGDMLFSWSGSLDICLWSGVEGVLNQHLFKVTSEKYPKWFYFYWLMRHLPEFRAIAAGKSTTMGHIQRHHLTDAKVIIPNKTFLTNSDIGFSPLFEKQIWNNQQVQILIKLRDTLLPKLMKGEIRVKYQ